MGVLFDLIHLIITVLIWLIVIDALLTWIPSIDRRHPLVKLLNSITDPILAPFRRLLPPEKTGYIDISPILVIVLLTIIDRVLLSI